MDSLFTWNAWAVIIPNLLIIVGWGITHYLNSNREEKAELRKAKKEIVIEIERCQELAVKYHTSKTRNIELENQLILLLERIDIKSEKLCKKLKLKNDFWNVKKAITKDNFESSRFIHQDFQSNIIQNIYIETNSQIKKFYLID